MTTLYKWSWPPPRLRCEDIRYKSIAYLLVLGGIVNDVGHQDRQQIGDTLNASGEGSIWSFTSRDLTSLASGIYPLPSY
jgi:hypothetical protein